MAGPSNKLDVIAPVLSAPTQDLKYMLASNVTVSNFVSHKLSKYKSNYNIWKAQMLCLIESQELLHIVNGNHPENKDDHMISLYDKLVKGWIFGVIEHKDVLSDLVSLGSAREVWMKLESLFKPAIRYTEGSRAQELGDTETHELKFKQASNVNVSEFVSVKLSSRSEYPTWKTEMRQLIENQGLLHIIDPKHSFPEDKGVQMINQYNKLVRSWIDQSVDERVRKDFEYFNLVGEVWMRLESSFNPPKRDSNREGFGFGIQSVGDVPEIENPDNNKLKKELYDAAVEGCWWKAKSILKIHKDAATEAITPNGNTILHIAVEMGHNYFVEKLLEFLKDGNKIETPNIKGRTALHIAAIVGNEYAAQLLVQKRNQLLVIEDNDKESPMNIISYINSDRKKLNIFAYMLKSAISFSFDAEKVARQAICTAIFAKQYDLARMLLGTYPLAGRVDDGILFAMITSFPTDLSHMEYFIYPSFNNVTQKIFVRVWGIFQYNFLDKCADDILRVVKIFDNMCCNWLGNFSMILVVPIATLYSIYQLTYLLVLVLHLAFSVLYFLLWKVLSVTVHPIKNIEKKKKEYIEAKEILSLICDQIGENISNSYEIFEAVRRDTYEVVDEILFRSPEAIELVNEGYNIVQLAIINRSEKVYNLIHHIVERTKSHRTARDTKGNTLAHLAGKLAPSVVLGRTTGAALQLQRELLWQEEVEKLMSPTELRVTNRNNQTPIMVFTKEHGDLLKQGENWMKTTAESCSITAALIVTVVFAAAITVPGGSNQDSGIPVFNKETAFSIFALSNAFSLFTATTSLLLFLSILTARFSEKDFLLSLPRRLIFGLLTLFLSTTAMIVAFGAILFLVFCDQRPWMLAPICGFACLPISVIVTVKVPLLVDLIRSTYFPIFGKQSYLESCKTNRKNTIFTD